MVPGINIDGQFLRTDPKVGYVVIADGGLEIIWRDQGWQELAGELMPGTIGAELQEWEQQEVEA